MEFGNRDNRFNLNPGAEEAFVDALMHLELGQMLTFSADGIEVSRWEIVDEKPHTMVINNVVSTFEGGHQERRPYQEFGTVEDFLAAQPKPTPLTVPELSVTERNAEAREWASSLPTTDQLLEVAEDDIATRPDAEDDLVACLHCGGEQVRTTACQCTRSGATYDNVASGTSLELIETVEPSDDCEACMGMGVRVTECGGCYGAGVMHLYPDVELVNAHTGEHHIITLDLARIILDEEPIIGGDMVDTPGMEEVSYELYVDVGAYIGRMLVGIEVDPTSFLRLYDKQVRPINFAGAETVIASSWWRQNEDGTVNFEPITKQDLALGLLSAQRDVASYFARPTVDLTTFQFEREEAVALAQRRGQELQPNGLVESNQYVFYRPQSFTEGFNKLLSMAANLGCKIAFDHSHYSVKNTGPAFHLMSEDGDYLRQLSGSSSLMAALENARTNLKKISDNS